MGVLGTSIFSDDNAADIRSRYRELLEDGKDGAEATEIVLREWQSELDNPVVWLALALTQSRCGRLEERVKQRALSIIDDGTEVRRWEELGASARDLKKRAAVLQQLRQQLESPQPSPSRIKKPYRATCDWDAGEVIAYRLASGRKALLRVITVERNKEGEWPACEVLDWMGDEVPDEKSIAALPLRQPLSKSGFSRPWFVIVRGTKKAFPEERVKRLGIRQTPKQEMGLPRSYVMWGHMDTVLAKGFGLE